MDFYSLLSQYYDDIFPVTDAKLEFFCDWFREHRIRTVLDVACGSGLLARRLAKAGYEVVGIDLEADMISQAREQAEAEQVQVEFIQGDMRKLLDLLKEPNGTISQFDAVTCVGNSLAHVLTQDEMQSVLQQLYAVSRPGGIAIIQIVNFDRILALGPTDLPDIVRKDKGFAFYRKYIPVDDGRVMFRSKLVLLDNGESFVNEITLRAIQKAELESTLQDIGYGNLLFFGGFTGAPYQHDSYATVVVAQKPEAGLRIKEHKKA